MSASIPNLPQSGATAQQQTQSSFDSGDFAAIFAIPQGTGVVSGGALTATGGTGVAVANATVALGGVQYAITGASFTLAAADLLLARVDLVVASSTAFTVIQGANYLPAVEGVTAGPAYAPFDPLAQVLVWAIYVGPAVSVLSSGMFGDRRMTPAAPLTAIVNGFNPLVTAGPGSQGPTITIPNPQWAIDGTGGAYWLNGVAIPSGYTAAVLGPDLRLYPIGDPAP